MDRVTACQPLSLPLRLLVGAHEFDIAPKRTTDDGSRALGGIAHRVSATGMCVRDGIGRTLMRKAPLCVSLCLTGEQAG